MSFSTDFIGVYSSIMTAATAVGTPFDQTKEFVATEVNNYNISEKEKAEILTTYLANITTNITTAAMQTAVAITDKEQKYPHEVTNMQKQTDLITAQIDKLVADTSYVETQELKLVEQVEHNKIIKAMDSMGDMIGTVGAGGLKPTATMWGTYYALNTELSGFAAPENPDLTPA